MLRVYDVAIEVVRELGPIIEQIGRRNRNLAGQLDRASSAVPLAIAEGTYARGGNRHAAYDRAIAEMRESLACCDVAVAKRYVEPLARTTRAKIDQVIGTLVNIVR
ncbi:MAG: four helix bundle protein [Deltaproteobacteria bacterium]|nr:four helix bundle protein [Deltaproteobacteria bacterium]